MPSKVYVNNFTEDTDKSSSNVVTEKFSLVEEAYGFKLSDLKADSSHFYNQKEEQIVKQKMKCHESPVAFALKPTIGEGRPMVIFYFFRRLQEHVCIFKSFSPLPTLLLEHRNCSYKCRKQV
jgi:hypothetical protein